MQIDTFIFYAFARSFLIAKNTGISGIPSFDKMELLYIR